MSCGRSTWQALSITIFMQPRAWRLKAKGSRFPVGVMPTEKKEMSESILSPRAMRAPRAVSGSLPSVPDG